jgi:hypothetical protein
MWFDFSEIVRPTRDGIHGREYISTSVDLGKRPPYLQFGKDGKLTSENNRNIEIPIPMLLDAPLASGNRGKLLLALSKAATKLETFAIINAREYSVDLLPYKSHLIPRIDSDALDRFTDLIGISRIVEVDLRQEYDVQRLIESIRRRNPSTLISLRFPYDDRSCDQIELLAKIGCDIVHCYIREEIVKENPDVVRNTIHSVHSRLVDKNLRDSITLIHAGGIAEAAHVPKSMILGADAVSIGLAYQIALGCKVCYGDGHAADCKMEMGVEAELAEQRIINLIGSWRDQLLEVLGGMGLREVRRQRGEIGRAIFSEDLEQRIFGSEE